MHSALDQCTKDLCILDRNSCIVCQTFNEEFLSGIEALRLAKVDKQYTNRLVSNLQWYDCRRAHLFALTETFLPDMVIIPQYIVNCSAFLSENRLLMMQCQVDDAVRPDVGRTQ